MPKITARCPQMGLLLFLTLISLFSLASVATAAPSWGDEFTLQQPDGTSVQVNIWGDEFYRVVESPDGYTLVRDPDSSEICFAVVSPDGADLVSTGVRFDTARGDDLDLEKHYRIDPAVSRKIITDARAAAEAHDLEVRASLGDKGDRVSPTTLGNVQGITLIIDFSDNPATIPASSVNNYLNQEGYSGYNNAGSVRDYFHDVSDGLLTYTNYVPTVYYRANQPMSYYDDCSAPYGSRARTLIIEALNHLNSQGFDFSDYDSNNDGIIDALNCFYAGYTSCGWSEGLWPHSSSLTWYADGVQTYKYQITGLGNNLTLSTFCHENGHMLCYWPDLYDYDGDSRGVGKYCLMCASTSSTNPQEPSAPMKYYANWGTAIALDSYLPNLVAPIADGTFFKFDHPTRSYEYYMIENRQRTGRDSGLPDSGLAIWHVDEQYGSNNYQDMTSSRHYEVTLVQADGRWDMENDRNTGDNTDLYAAPMYDECGPATNPNTNWWDGSASIMQIKDISISQNNMTFTFNPAGESYVPSQYPTIQAAIDAATNGETIVVDDGTYTGPGNIDLDTQGKIITIKAQNAGPNTAVIDCGGSSAEPHRAFIFNGAEGAGTIIEGITIINGYAAGDGGAILCDGSSPTLTGLFFSGNEAAGNGGALAIGSGDTPVVENCVFTDNSAVYGGALAATSTAATVTGCTFYGNSATSGAALACLGSGSLAVYNSLVSYSLTADAAYCASAGDSIILECSDVFGNMGGDWVGCLAGQDSGNGNFSSDPFFCDAGAGIFTLREDSPCIGGMHPEGAAQCGGENIGALGVGCFAEIFTAITTGPLADGGNGQAAAWGDYDGDGDPDLFLVNRNQPDVLLRNDLGGVFTDVTAAPLGDDGPGAGAAWADYDNDGDLDLYLGRNGASNRLYRNDGFAGFVDVTVSPLDNDGETRGVNWVDYDNDGNVDLFITSNLTSSALIKNFGDLGGGNFFFFNIASPVLNLPGLGLSASWGDYDNDGDQDVYIVRDGSNILAENGGSFGFLDITDDLTDLGSGRGAAWADINNDSLLDLYVTNYNQADVLWRNGGTYFSLVSGGPLGSTGAGNGVAWGDFDNDGLQDFILSQYGGPVELYWNHGDNVFTSLGVPDGMDACQGATWCDYDLDGDLDAYITKYGNNVLLRNDFAQSNHWLHVDLEGITSNRAAIGTRVRAVAGGISQIREVTAGSGGLGMNSLTVEFGLGAASMVDSLVISWPSGIEDVLVNLAVDRRISLFEDQGVSAVAEGSVPGHFALHANVPNPFNPTTTINYELPRTSAVSLKVYDIAGRLVRQLRSGETETAGSHQVVFNGQNDRGQQVASGTYFYRLDAGSFSATHRMVLIK